jgi:hypothetical protein
MMHATARRLALAAMVSVVAAAGWASAVGRDGPPRELLRMHDDFVLAFVQSEGFGRMRITPMMRVMQRYRTSGDPSLWVTDVQLIGIARHDPPQVFSSAFQGFQHVEDRAAEFPVHKGRPMTAQEAEDVRALEGGQRLLVRTEETGLRVSGPIRAGDECLGCHKDKRAGDMLGAFVYTLRPLPEVAPAR